MIAPKTVLVAELVEDYELYPRRDADGQHVQRLAEALLHGVEMPPVIADRKTKVIIDGWHRCRAAIKVQGEGAKVACIFRSFKSRAEMLIAAVEANSSHGHRLQEQDRVRCVQMLKALGVKQEKICVALKITETAVEKLSFKIAVVPRDAKSIPGTNVIATKAGSKHMAQTEITKDQARVIGSAPGVSYLLIARQLREALDFEVANRGDENLREELKELAKSIRHWL